MVRQARSEATRHKIIDSAVDLINEVGYPAAGLADIIERAELTKGALYYHFDSKEALATTIIEDGGMKMLVAFQEACRAGSPSMENVIHGVFMVSDIINSDRLARAASRLLRTFGGFNTAAKPVESKPRELRRSYVVASASDGYEVVFSWAELFVSPVGDSVYIVYERNCAQRP